ncbi:hypothetical protein PCNPT3_05575 [Psychromonas sp. CNPT3]|uniref:hypothetical protein n=1 Tax=Psychromonas sp. CNPT3 TaxID=314282 RepID=UPI00006E4232|nr:hypothetical protein [Psychromonas sp. CNPT3]AGH81057.1 hypothetical protein PCNPT3_05575 [Psychromonas sp. CNPT3]
MAEIIMSIGFIICIIGGILLVIQAFKMSLVWGLLCLFLMPVTFIFTVVHWPVAKKPFFIQLIGMVFFVIGTFMANS